MVAPKRGLYFGPCVHILCIFGVCISHMHTLFLESLFRICTKIAKKHSRRIRRWHMTSKTLFFIFIFILVFQSVTLKV